MSTPAITISTTIASDADTVWHHWTQPEHIVNWNFASADWHCPNAENNLEEGGRFCYTMAAKDGSMSFGFEGVYEEIIPKQKISYRIADGRKVDVLFEEGEGTVVVTEIFEPEQTHSEEMQRAGWQSILDQFKNYVESR